MTHEDQNNIITKTVKGILVVLIPMLITGWAGTYVMVRVALAQHEQMIQRNKDDIKELRDNDYDIWQHLLDRNTERGKTVK